MANPVYNDGRGAPGGVTGRIVPIYRLTAGLSQRVMMQAVRQGLDECGHPCPRRCRRVFLSNTISARPDTPMKTSTSQLTSRRAGAGPETAHLRGAVHSGLPPWAVCGRQRKVRHQNQKADFEEFYRTCSFFTHRRPSAGLWSRQRRTCVRKADVRGLSRATWAAAGKPWWPRRWCGT